jgi:Zn finger protein HypA/HybF involved in hydrogenase expression
MIDRTHNGHELDGMLRVLRGKFECLECGLVFLPTRDTEHDAQPSCPECGSVQTRKVRGKKA